MPEISQEISQYSVVAIIDAGGMDHAFEAKVLIKKLDDVGGE